MSRLYKNIFLSNRFFYAAGLIVFLFCVGFLIPAMVWVAQGMIALLLLLTIIEGIMLFRGSVKISADRSMARLLSLGNENRVTLRIGNESSMHLRLSIVDELPYQLQIRDFEILTEIAPGEQITHVYEVRPVVRGSYAFGRLHTFIKSGMGLLERRISHKIDKAVPVYPSVIDMRKYELRHMDRTVMFYGMKRIRKVGNSTEFDQIKDYIQGDDVQHINWKATSRSNRLMVNHYEDEKSQQIYTIIDKSRAMQMPFHGMSLLDYAINTGLVISNTALGKGDKAGLITFSHVLDSVVKAERNKTQLKRILESLYSQEEGSLESNFELLYSVVRNRIQGRSLLFLYTNFESLFALERALPLLRSINNRHLLVVVFFENAEMDEYGKKEADSLREIFLTTVSQKFVYEKYQIMSRLQQFGIQTILTKPEDLSINSINKYLELKARRMI